MISIELISAVVAFPSSAKKLLSAARVSCGTGASPEVNSFCQLHRLLFWLAGRGMLRTLNKKSPCQRHVPINPAGKSKLLENAANKGVWDSQSFYLPAGRKSSII